LPSQLAYPSSHAIPHRVPSHVATAFAPVGHGTHAAPHVAVLMLLAHALPQAWKLESHVNRHAAPVQLATPFVTDGQASLHAPQSSSDVDKLTHWVPQSVGASLPHPVVQANPDDVGEQSGAVESHFALQAPQWAALERSVSQPSAAC
jgi:hypothetical protein